MAKKKTVADQSRSGHVSSFTGGLNTDLHPMLQPNDTLTDCVNGTLITYNGNENMLQNDMGNYELKHAQLPEGYIPMGMKEHQGILYIASWNPFEKRAQIGSYPSPKTVFGEENGNEYTISPIEIGEINTEGFSNSQLAELIFNIAEKNTKDLPEGVDPSKHLVRDIDLSQTERVFTDNFDENTKLGAGDRYWLSTLESDSSEDDFQKLEYFLIDEDKNKYNITDSIVCNKQEKDSPNADDFTPVTFDHSGWLGATYVLKDMRVPDIDVTINENAFTSENYLEDIKEIDGSTAELENIEEVWSTRVPAYQVSTMLHNIPIQDVYPAQSVEVNNSKIETVSKFNTDNPEDESYIYVHAVLNFIPDVEKIFYIQTGSASYSVTCKFHVNNNFNWDLIKTIFNNSAFVASNLGIDIYISNGVPTMPLYDGKINKLVVAGVQTIITGWHESINTLYMYRNSRNAIFNIEALKNIETVWLDQQSRLFFSIKHDNLTSLGGVFSFNVGNSLDNERLIHQLDIFGTEIYNWNSGNFKNIETVRIGSPVYNIVHTVPSSNAKDNTTFVINNSCPKQIRVSCSKSVNFVLNKNAGIVLNKENSFEIVKLIKLQEEGTINIWVNGDIGFANHYPDNLYSSNVYATDDYYFNLTDNNTCVESVVCNADMSVDEIVVPEGITSIGAMLFKNHIKTLDLPKTLNKIGSDFYEELVIVSEDYDVDNLILRSNFRPSSKGIFTAKNIYVVPNNLYYYNKHRPYSDNGTTYFNLSAFECNTSGNEKHSVYNYELSLKTNSDYTLLSNIFGLLNDPYIITPRGNNINIPQCSIVDKNILMSYSKVINNLSCIDLPEGLSFSSAKVLADCKIEKGVISNNQEWTVTKNTSVDLSNLALDDTVTLNVLGINNINEINRFVSFITFPELEKNEDKTFKIIINSSAGYITPDFSRTGIKIEFNGGEFGDIKPNNTIEYKPSSTSWTYCNITPSFEGELNTYTVSFVGIGENNYDSAWNTIINSCGHILQESVLLLPTAVSWKDFIDDKFKLIVHRSDSENSIQISDKILANTVLEGNKELEYHKYAWNLEPKSIGEFKVFVSVLGWKDSAFGIKVRTPLFKYEDGILKIKDFYASLHDIQLCDVSNSDPKANIVIKTESLQDNCKVAIRVKHGSDEKKYYVLSNTQLSISDEVVKSESYTVDSYVFKQSNNQILIEDLNVGSININKNSIVDDLSIYRYGKHGNKLRIQLEWPQAIDQTECYWTISDLNNNIVVQGEILENMYFDSVDLDVDLAKLDDYWYVFSYYTPNKIYRRPLFAKTKTTYTDGTFNGPNCVDYINAYYEDLAESSSLEMNYTSDDLAPIDNTYGKIFDLTYQQVYHKKVNSESFTWDNRYFKESKKALWWDLMDEFEEGHTNYLGTRKYQKVTLDLEKFGFIKGVTEYSVELRGEGFDTSTMLKNYGIYDVNNSDNEFIIPVGESIHAVVPNGTTIPFKKEYLIQNAFSPIDDTTKYILSQDDNPWRTFVINTVCDWDKGKMLFVDKTSGETNDCSIAVLDPTKYDKDSDSFDGSKIISGEGNFVSKILSKVNNLFVPIVAQIKSDDNGFVFPVVQNNVTENGEYKWKYAETWDEARGKKNSDNKRSVWKDHTVGDKKIRGLGAIVHTKNNLAMAIGFLVAGFAEIAAAIATLIAGIVLGFFSGGTATAVSIAAVVLMFTAAGGIQNMIKAGFDELKKEKKVFKLFAIRGKDRLFLPLWGKQSEHDGKRRNFDGQIRYENINWAKAEQLMLYLGSRIYAKLYSENRYIPVFTETLDNEEVPEINRTFKLIITFKNIDIKSGGISLKSLEKMFKDIYKIETTNFTLKVSEASSVEVDFYKNKSFDVVNKWIGGDDFETLEYQLEHWCDSKKEGENIATLDLPEDTDPLILHFAECLEFDPEGKYFYYNEKHASIWYEDDPRWAFGPNRGGCRMRLKRNYRKSKDGKPEKISKDKDWIDIGEFPRFNNDVITPIAYPILPYQDYPEGSNGGNRSENIVNSYDQYSEDPVLINKINIGITKEDLITEDCMNYLEYICYDKIKEKLQNTDSTN